MENEKISDFVAFGFPLTKNIYLYIDETCGDGINTHEIDQDFCHSLNRWTMFASDEAVFSSDKCLIEKFI